MWCIDKATSLHILFNRLSTRLKAWRCEFTIEAKVQTDHSASIYELLLASKGTSCSLYLHCAVSMESSKLFDHECRHINLNVNHLLYVRTPIG